MIDKYKINDVVEGFKSLSDDEKKYAAQCLRKEWPFFDYENFENPVTTKENIKELQEKIVQLCIDYINNHNLTDIDEIHFNADELQFSSKYKKWTPQTDSYIGVFGQQKDENGIIVRKKIGDYW